MSTRTNLELLAALLIVTGLLPAAGCRYEPGERSAAPADAPPSPISAGAAVRSVFPTGPGDVYGLRVDDVLVGWRQGPDSGRIESPLDARRLEDERAPLGGLRLEVVRRGERTVVPVASGRWEGELAPVDPAGRRKQSGAGDPGDEATRWQTEGLALAEARSEEQAGAALNRALDLRRRRDPDSVAVAATLVHLAELARPADRKPLLEEARTILERRAPAGVDLAYVLNQLGIHASLVERDFDAASALYRRALEIRLRTIPNSHRTGNTYGNLADTARLQGRLDDAEQLIQEAVVRYPPVPDLAGLRAGAFNTMALIQRDKGSYRLARENWETALAIFRQLDPGGPAVAGVSNNLGNLALRLGDLGRARARHEESLALRRQLAPESAAVAASLNNLGTVALEQGRLDEARAYLGESQALKERFAPDSLSHSNTLQNLGEVRAREGDDVGAERLIRRALAIRKRIAPRSIGLAESHILLGRVLARQGRFGDGIESWRKGIDLLDETRQAYRFSAQERTIFASRFQDHYRDLARLLAEQGWPEEAFDLVERSRARALRMMAYRHGSAAAEAPALSLRPIQEALDPGTRLVLFSVNENHALVFVVSEPGSGGEGIAWHQVAVERRALERRTELFRALIARGRRQPEVERALIRQARSLFELLLQPVAEHLEPAERLIVVPDRPLSTLPFAALVMSEDPVRFLGHWKPLSYSVSGTTFALAKSRRRPVQAEPSLAVYARSRAVEVADATWGSLPPLPGAVEEARRVAQLFAGSARTLLDGEARESALKSAVTSGYLHFATHAVTDSRSPLDSALLLEPGEGEDGLLHAWEVIDELALKSDLVTLSACETGLGRDLGGEGVLGLSHAFLFAGARTVVTSLWPVSDRSTADWMEAFYGGLRRGVARDRAVMEAQARVMSVGEGTGHPFYWAAFQLWGDWAGHAGGEGETPDGAAREQPARFEPL